MSSLYLVTLISCLPPFSWLLDPNKGDGCGEEGGHGWAEVMTVPVSGMVVLAWGVVGD